MRPEDTFSILMADDDADDRLMAEEAFDEARVANPLGFVKDGEQLLDYLNWRNGYNADNAPRPGLILLDLNMPKMDGRTALRHIKADPNLRSIPVVILTTSSEKGDVSWAYDLGASGYVSKPITFSGLVDSVRTINEYWVKLVMLPT